MSNPFYQDQMCDEEVGLIARASGQLEETRNPNSSRLQRIMRNPATQYGSFGVDQIRAGLCRIQYDYSEIKCFMKEFIQRWEELAAAIEFKTESDELVYGRKIQQINGMIDKLYACGALVEETTDDND